MALQHFDIRLNNHPIPHGWLPDTRVVNYAAPIHFPTHRLPQDCMAVRFEDAQISHPCLISHVQALWIISSAIPPATFGGAAWLSLDGTPARPTIDNAEHDGLLEESLREYGEIWKDLADR
jgi:hypothetical protein